MAIDDKSRIFHSSSFRMDQNNSLEITFDEWRSFFINNPTMLDRITADPREMLRYWRNAPVCFT